MSRRLAVLVAVPLLAISAVLLVRWRAGPLSPPAAPEPLAVPSSEPGPRAQWVVRKAAELPPPPAMDEGAADAAAHAALPQVALGSSPVGERLPLCGRRGDVAFRSTPGGRPLEEAVQSCEAMGEISPWMEPVDVREQQGDWLGTGKGWLSIREVRTVEYLLVEGREYWHDLFESELHSFDGRVVTLKGAADTCAGVACGDGDPGPREKREERTFELEQRPARGRAAVEVHSGGYLCCT